MTDPSTQTFSHTETFTHRHFCTQHTHFHTQRLLHTDAFTQKLLHTETFTMKSQRLLHTDAFYTQKLLHTNDFTHRSFHTQKLLHTNTFTHRDQTREIAVLPLFLAIKPHFVRKGLCPDARNHNFTSVFGDRTSFRAKRFAGRFATRNFKRSNLISCEKVAPDDLQLAILPHFLAIEPHFVRKGRRPDKRNRNLTPVFGDRAHFVQKGCDGKPEIAILLSGLGDRTSIRAKRLRFVPSRWHCPAPSREK